MDPKTIEYYGKNAAAAAERYESVVNGLAAHFGRAFGGGPRVLDIGCGSGRDLAYLLELGKEAYGLDAAQDLVNLAQTLHPELKGRIAWGALPEALVPFKGEFDGVLCCAVLMHLPSTSLPLAVDFIKRCLKPSGTVLYSVPSKRLDALGGSHRDAAGRLFVPDTDGRLQGLFEAQGFTLIDQWQDTDSLGRDEVAWVSVLMELVGHERS